MVKLVSRKGRGTTSLLMLSVAVLIWLLSEKNPSQTSQKPANNLQEPTFITPALKRVSEPTDPSVPIYFVARPLLPIVDLQVALHIQRLQPSELDALIALIPVMANFGMDLETEYRANIGMLRLGLRFVIEGNTREGINKSVTHLLAQLNARLGTRRMQEASNLSLALVGRVDEMDSKFLAKAVSESSLSSLKARTEKGQSNEAIIGPDSEQYPIKLLLLFVSGHQRDLFLPIEPLYSGRIETITQLQLDSAKQEFKKTLRLQTASNHNLSKSLVTMAYYDLSGDYITQLVQSIDAISLLELNQNSDRYAENKNITP